MHISHGPGNRALRNFQYLRELGSIKVAARADLNPRISALGDQRREPTDFQLQSDHDQQVRLPQPQKKTRLGLNKMWVLITLGNGLHIDLVTAHFLRKRRQVGGRRYYVELLRGCNVRKNHACHSNRHE